MSTHHNHNLASDLLNHANEFRAAAERLSKIKPFLYHPTFYAALHSVELGLKSHLMLAGFSKKQLASRALGHDLKALVTSAHAAGAIPFLDTHAKKAIAFGGKDYSRKCFEYPELMVSTLPIGRWLALAKMITDNAEASLKQ